MKKGNLWNMQLFLWLSTPQRKKETFLPYPLCWNNTTHKKTRLPESARNPPTCAELSRPLWNATAKNTICRQSRWKIQRKWISTKSMGSWLIPTATIWKAAANPSRLWITTPTKRLPFRWTILWHPRKMPRNILTVITNWNELPRLWKNS